MTNYKTAFLFYPYFYCNNNNNNNNNNNIDDLSNMELNNEMSAKI